jgi:aspartate racemase
LYAAYSGGRESPLGELETQYADYALWQREWLQGEVLEEQLGYWKGQLRGAPPVLELPADKSRPAVPRYGGSGETIKLSSELTEELKQICKSEGVTLFMTLLAGFDVLLHLYTEQVDIVVGTDVANRNQVTTENVIGFFINQLVLRTDLAGNPTFRELLGRVREVTLGAYAHQDLPFDRLVKALRPERELSRAPLFQVKFAVQNLPLRTIELSGLTLNSVEIDMERAHLDLTVFVWETGQGISGLFEYDTDLFSASTISRMVNHFELLLKNIVANPDARLSELSGAIDRNEPSARAIETREQKESSVMKFRSARPKAINVFDERNGDGEPST